MQELQRNSVLFRNASLINLFAAPYQSRIIFIGFAVGN